MSTYANSNFAPPPTATGQQQQQQQQQQQMPNMVNGLTAIQQQQQQPQQQQQILLQKQLLQQQPPAATMLNNSNMSKFLPPTSNANFPTTALNGPATLQPQASATGAQITPLSNLPSHLRPPPGSAASTTAPPAAGLPSAPFTNGGGGGGGVGSGTSTNSSRTASPALQTMLPPQTQTSAANPLQQRMHLPPQQQQQQLRTTLPPPNVSGLTSTMQNVNLNGVHSAGAVMPPQQQPQQQPQQMTFTNFQSNVKPPPIGQQAAAAAASSPQTTAFAPPGNVPSNPTAPPPAVSINNSSQPTAFPPTSMSYKPNPTQNLFALNSGKPPLNQQPPMHNANYPTTTTTTSISGVPPLLPPATTQQLQQQQQSQLNNNQQQFSAPQQQHQQQQLPPSILRKPMYPTQAQLPTMPPQQQQQQQQQATQFQQQPYAQAYQQQPQHTPGMFNGQPSSGPLQYQSQQQQQQQQQQQYPNQQPNIVNQGFSRLWGQDTIDLMQNRHILTPATLPPPKITLHNQFHESVNCSPNIMRCTIAKIPESNSLLQKSRLPLGILIHPFRDINSLPVIQCPSIVRCRLCRTYINPFVYFVDSKMWKCNLCYRVNELPDDFHFDPATKTYGDVTRRPEVRSSTIEFIAPSEYMLRPPQPAMYLFLFDVSIIAQQSGYLENVCAVLSKYLEEMPGDARTQVGFIAYNSHVHFYGMAEGYNQPHEMTLLDIDDEPFLPRPDNLLVNLRECKEIIRDLLQQLPKRFADTHDPGCALGPALQVAYKLMQGSGGRVTVFQTCLPNKGAGSLEPREDPNNRSAKDVAHLNPATDFYKRFALECAGYQIAVDLFLLNQQYSDLATISGVSKHSGGCVHHFPLYQKTKQQHIESLKQCFKRYLTRKIGFEAVMRIRCTRGLQVHTFHGNFFVRSTDLLSLPNVNPDAGYGMQISYEESLSDVKTMCFQAALLYTNSEGERRIRVHTLCLPVTASLPELMHAADVEAIIGLLSKMAVDRSLGSNLADAREAFINASVDIFNAFKIAQNLPAGQTGTLIAPRTLALLPLYILALMKHPAFRIGTSTRLDDRVYAMDCMKTLPLDQLMKYIYPEFYNINCLFYNTQQNSNANTNLQTTEDDEEEEVPIVPRLQLSAEYLDSRCIFLLDCGTSIIIYVGLNVPVYILESVFGIKSTAELPDYYYGLPNVNSPENDMLKRFMMRLNDEKPYQPLVQIIRDTSTAKPQFMEKLIEDRSESSLSYYEFIQHIRSQVK